MSRKAILSPIHQLDSFSCSDDKFALDNSLFLSSLCDSDMHLEAVDRVRGPTCRCGAAFSLGRTLVIIESLVPQ